MNTDARHLAEIRRYAETFGTGDAVVPSAVAAGLVCDELERARVAELEALTRSQAVRIADQSDALARVAERKQEPHGG